MKIRTEKIIDPSEEIFCIQQKSLDELVSLLPNSHVEAVGAMAVPMVGRPELDLLVLTDDIEGNSKILAENGYKQGPVVDHKSFLKKMVGEVEVAVQIMAPDHPMVETHRRIMKMLQDDSDLRSRYEDFKRTLAGLTREEYKVRKNQWVEDNLLKK